MFFHDIFLKMVFLTFYLFIRVISNRIQILCLTIYYSNVSTHRTNYWILISLISFRIIKLKFPRISSSRTKTPKYYSIISKDFYNFNLRWIPITCNNRPFKTGFCSWLTSSKKVKATATFWLIRNKSPKFSKRINKIYKIWWNLWITFCLKTIQMMKIRLNKNKSELITF